MSGAGLLVVGTMCLALLAVIVTACWMAVQGTDIPEALDRVLQGLLIGVPALLAKTYRDVQGEPDNQTDEPPTPVEIVQDEPVETREVGPADMRANPEALPVGMDEGPPRRRR